jgi:hypothetical protein
VELKTSHIECLILKGLCVDSNSLARLFGERSSVACLYLYLTTFKTIPVWRESLSTIAGLGALEDLGILCSNVYTQPKGQVGIHFMVEREGRLHKGDDIWCKNIARGPATVQKFVDSLLQGCSTGCVHDWADVCAEG